MPEEPFTVHIEAATGVLVARAQSFWKVETLHEFTASIMASIEVMKRQGRPVLLLIDAREHGVQSQEVVIGLQRWAHSDAVKAVRTAVIVPSALYRRQARRISSPGNHELFSDEVEARAWLGGGTR